MSKKFRKHFRLLFRCVVRSHVWDPLPQFSKLGRDRFLWAWVGLGLHTLGSVFCGLENIAK
jgi:hypothetical protein